MQKSTLYPELSTDEIETIISPLDECALPLGAPTAGSHLVHPRVVPLDEFGVGVENFSFELVSDAVAEDFWHHNWDESLETHLQDAQRFARETRAILAADFLSMAIRPLVDVLQPREDKPNEDTYREFCQRLLADALVEFTARFPLMWHRVQIRMGNRIKSIEETVRRVHADTAELACWLDIDPSVKLVSISASGDTHGAGRAVSVLVFSDATRVIYKPRPVDGEAAYSALCMFMHQEFGRTFGAAVVLPKSGYGYVQFVDAVDDAIIDMSEVGSLAALLYALNARDMHFSNIISTAKGPVPVDLETLLHPYRHKATGTVETSLSAYRQLETSVFGTGVLPLVMTKEGHDGFIDVGYLGGGEIRGRGPFRRLRLESPFRADMRVTWDDSTAPAQQRREEVGSVLAQEVRMAADTMVAGFTVTYQLIMTNLAVFAEQVTLLFKSAELRYIHNPTVQYDQCLRLLTGSAASSDDDLARGLTKRIGIASRDADVRLVKSECQQLWATDVPYFLMGADSQAITDSSTGRAVIATLEQSPLEQFHAKLASLSDSDLARQIRLIRVAFNAKLPDPHGMTASHHVLAVPTSVSPKKSRTGPLRDLAASLGRTLVADMVQDRYAHLPRTWIGPVASADAERPWPPGVLGYDLYTGRIGPALALAALGATLGEETFVEAANSIFVPAAAILTSQSYEVRSIAQAGLGAYNGFSGTLWALAAAGRLTGQKQLVDAALEGRRFLIDPDPKQTAAWFDFVSGGMGALLVRLGLGGDDRVDQDTTSACSRALDEDLVHGMEYSGLAHGLAGLVFFGARSHGGTGLPITRDLTLAAYEELMRSFRGSQPGIRTNRSGKANYSDSWCNGLGGVLVALSEAVRHGLLDDGEITRLLDAVWDSRLSTSLTLCHGLLGLHEILGGMPGVSSSKALALQDRIAGYLTPDLLENGLQDHGSRYNQSSGLMVGQSSVAWHLVSRIASERLPSPLALDGPL